MPAIIYDVMNWNNFISANIWSYNHSRKREVNIHSDEPHPDKIIVLQYNT